MVSTRVLKSVVQVQVLIFLPNLSALGLNDGSDISVMASTGEHSCVA
ncbi:tail fiber protein [Salmonella phage 19]|nr:tail fiber protein [Salmonella phage 19]